MTTRTVERDGVRLATTDHGGSGPALVLAHGAGMQQASLTSLAERLTGAFRVVTFDFRGHGGSDAAPWTTADAVADLRAVVEAYGLERPVVAGHSLGGMVATAYALEHSDCAGVVNIDGHGRGRLDQYVGRDVTEVQQWWDQVDRRLGRLTRGVVSDGLRALLRALRQQPITGETSRQIHVAVDALDLFAMYPQVACPLLVFNATAPETRRSRRLLAGDGIGMVAVLRQGLARDLAALAAEHPSVEVATVDATHMLIRTHPDLVAQRITSFVQQHATR